MDNKEIKVKSVNELKEMVNKLPITPDIFESMATAKNFIKENMYGISKDDAEMIIDYTIKDHFSFKSNDMKKLKQYYKSFCDEFHVRELIKGDYTILPKWYKSTDKSLKFLPFVLAKHISEEEHIIFAESEYYQYANGVYSVIPDNRVNRLIQEKMIETEANMYAITDTAKQLQLLIQKESNELNTNSYLINLKNTSSI